MIDIHSHFYPRSYLDRLKAQPAIPRIETVGSDDYFVIFPQELRGPGDERGPVGRPLDASYWDLEAKLAWMDQAGITMTVLSIGNPWVDFLPPDEAEEWAAHLNGALREAARRHPARVAALGVLPLHNVSRAARELTALSEAGFRGAIISTRPGGRMLDDRSLWPLFEHAEALEMPLFVHPHDSLGGDALLGYGHGLPLVFGFIFETTVAIARLILSGALDEFPSLRVVVAHLGGTLPYTLGRLNAWAAARDARAPQLRKPPGEYVRQLYLDAISYHGPAVRCAAETVGIDHLLFGSDHPFAISNIGLVHESIRDAGFTERERDKLLRRNAQELFRL